MPTSTSIERLLNELSSSKPRTKYIPVSLYLPFRLAFHFRSVAANGGWELGDLARALILAGFAFRVLQVPEEQHASEMRLSGSIGELTRMITRRIRRPYQMNSGEGRGSRITIRLSKNFMNTVSVYAESTGRSRNVALGLFLKAGLLVYLSGYVKLLRIIEAGKGSGGTGSVQAS